MRYRLPDDGPNLSAGSLSSMIDIIFLLIIFFVVTASFDREQLDADVVLPTVDSAALKSMPPERIMVNILADGSVKVGFHQLTSGEIAAKLGPVMKTMKAGRETILILNGDRETPHKYISAVMNAAARAGYSQVRLNAEVRAEGH